MPRLVPHGHARKADGMVAVVLGAQAIIHIVEFDEQRLRQADLAHDLRGNQAHPPTIEIGIRAPVQLRRVPQRLRGEVMVVFEPGGGLCPVRRAVVALAERVQHRAVVEVEHAAAHDRRSRAVVGELHGAHDRLRLADRVVIEQQRVVAFAGLHCLVHAAREPPGAAHVALAHVGELAAQIFRHGGEARLVAHQIGALVGAVDRVEPPAHIRVGGDRLELVEAVRRAVERGDGDRQRAVAAAARLNGHAPRGVFDRQVVAVAGLGVEPEEAAVHEAGHGEFRAHGRRAGRRIDVDGAGGLKQAAAAGAEQHDGAAAAHACTELHSVDACPAPPIAGGEGVEERAQRGMAPGEHGERRAPVHTEHVVRAVGRLRVGRVFKQRAELGLRHLREVERDEVLVRVERAFAHVRARPFDRVQRHRQILVEHGVDDAAHRLPLWGG